VIDDLRAELAAAEAELRAHLASWDYAFAMASAQSGGEHPRHWATRARTTELVRERDVLRARLAELDA
jgi:hypothetical protein